MPEIGPVARTGVNYGETVFVQDGNKELTGEDFLQLMIQQLQNQDFMNPVDDTQYLTQMAQFTTMQQMQELAAYSKQNYVLSLVGQTVTAAKFKLNGEVEKITGPITKISLVDNEYQLYIGDQQFSLSQIMELGAGKPGIDNEPEAGTDYAQAGFMMGLVGHTVTVDGPDGKLTGVVEKMTLRGGARFMVGGKWYGIAQLDSIEQDGATVSPEKPEDSTEPEGGTTPSPESPERV